VRELPPPRPAWPDQPRLGFDAACRPVWHRGTVLVGCSRDDSVLALDAATGEERWRFSAGGPVRLAPAAWDDRVYFVSDDGCLYCADAGTGRLVWKFRGAPSERLLLGNGRLVSAWPARGGPVVVPESGGPGDPHRAYPGVGSGEATVYFAAGVWPFMGVFLHALDARTGAVLWTNGGEGARYMKQPHQADAFGGVAPQGTLVVAGDRLLVPGRPVPACFDRATGRLLHFRLADDSKLGGGSDVLVNDHLFVNGGGAFDLASGDYLGPVGEPAVLTPDALYAAFGAECRAYDARRSSRTLVRTVDPKGRAITRPGLVRRTSAPLPGAQALAAGPGRLFVAAARQVFATPLPLEHDSAPHTWQASVDGTPTFLASLPPGDAAGEGLLVSTREGRLYCFGQQHAPPRLHRWAPSPPTPRDDRWGRRAEKVLRDSGVRDGYCVAWGVGTGRLVTELALRTRLHVIAVEPDEDRAAAVRGDLEAAGLYGERVAVIVARPDAVALPPYLASLMVSEDPAGFPVDEAFLRRAFPVLRPYGGAACLPLPAGWRPNHSAWAGRADDLAQARFRVDGADLWVTRPGPLPGAADWTHEHADPANTRVSHDRRVLAPLGLLWFGGPGHQGILPRHGHGPQPQVSEGRLLVEGVDLLRALDVYTGRQLWEAPLPGVGKVYDNPAHQPGANATGTNFVSTPAGIYVAHGALCRRLDPATGRETAAFRLPVLPGEREPPAWDYVTVVGDFLVGGCSPHVDVPRGKLPPLVWGSKHLVVLDRATGRVLWQRTAANSFRHNAVCAGGGRLFVIDRPGPRLPAWLGIRVPLPAGPARLSALDLRTGKEVWGATRDVFGTWLSYSEPFDVLVEAGRVARDTLSDEPRGMRAYKGSDGRVLWHRPDYVGPAMIHGDRILRDRGGCDLRTGKPTMVHDPLTGKMVEWAWTRTYGCATPLASEHLLTFRSGAAGYYDLCRDGGTGNLGGFRAGCTNNLIVADGVLTAADYTRQCTCSYQNQSSLALVPMPEADLWTYQGPGKVEGVVRRVGIALGAPGNRKADDGTLWLEFPPAGGPSPRPEVRTRPAQPRWFRQHPSQVGGDGPAWVTASGACGLEEIVVRMAPAAGRPRRYTVRLYFLEPDGLPPGRRRFHVRLQGREVLHDLDVSAEAGGPGRGLVREFRAIPVDRDLTVKLTPAARAPVPQAVLCGIEAVAEGW
jgi:outer membrane protein assembly factor BamB